MNSPVLITKKRILLVEGKDEENFFCALLQKLQISDVQIRSVGGKEKFKEAYPSFVKQSGFTKVHTIGFVRDAEDGRAEDAFKSICDIIKKFSPSFPVPEKPGEIKEYNSYKTGVYIMPDCNNPGMLENLCIESVKDTELYNAADEYVCRAESLYEGTESGNKKFNKPKAVVQTYLAGTVPIRNNIGLAALQQVWNFSDSAFDGIKKFIQELLGQLTIL